jgi:disulfide bond formation protein DsbB
MFLQTTSKWPARVLAFICLGSLATLGIALIAQHQFGVKPCPWCVMQRGIHLLLAAVAALGWLLQRWRPARAGALLLTLALALAGVASAYYQHEVAAQSASCAMTLADQIVTKLNLEELWPPVFMVTANCAEAAAYRLLGQPYELWSGAFYLIVALASLWALGRNRRR